jgi:hypothetical protein
MKKLILLVTLLVTFGASAGQITHEQLVKINKFNKDWTNILAMENKGFVYWRPNFDRLAHPLSV